MSRPLEPVVLSENERAELGGLAARRKTAQALALRARIVLLAAEGVANKDVAARLNIDPGAVIGKGYPCHRAIEFRRFLDEIEKVVPDDLDGHLQLQLYRTSGGLQPLPCQTRRARCAA